MKCLVITVIISIQLAT